MDEARLIFPFSLKEREIEMKKRVYTLYRVSTKGQVEKDDIPMQKEACRNFAESQGWEIVKEFSEKGVSGFKKSAKERDELQKIQQAAMEGKFDILLVFMFDRLDVYKRQLQVNTTKASNFVLQASMLYAAVVLMVICLTVLSLQQLLDASQYKYRFSVLRKLGVEDTHIGKLVLKQLGIWFGLPIVVAIIVSTMVIIYFIQTISAEISAYIGFGALMSQIGTTVSILALLLICYFISTWLLFKKSIK